MDLGLAGKTVIVTGGGSNIGRKIVHTFAEEKSNVVIAEIDPKQGEIVASECKSYPGKVIVVKCDITNWDDVQAMVKKAIETFNQVDALVNCAGWVSDKPFVKKPREEWEKEIAINYWGAINCIRGVLDHMIERTYGRIVTVISDAGRTGGAMESVYAGAKAGAVGTSKSIAQEVGRYNITLNQVSPGATIPENLDHDIGEFSMHKVIPRERYTAEFQEMLAKRYPLRRLGKAQDIANAVVFLASDRASWITGQTLSVSGGWSMI